MKLIRHDHFCTKHQRRYAGKRFCPSCYGEVAEDIRYRLTVKLDWIRVLADAVKGRPTSWHASWTNELSISDGWYSDPVTEWRNASDEVWGALMRHAEKAGIFPDREKAMRKAVLKFMKHDKAKKQQN